MLTTDPHLTYIFDGKPSTLSAEFEEWVRGSRRFKSFAIEYRDKIRAKVRNVRDKGGNKDLHAELETAMLLLRAEKFSVEYETYAASKQRGPDFTVTYKTHTRFNVEVRRIRNVELEEGSVETHSAKLMTVLCEKVKQMPPSIMNLLWLTGEREIASEELQQAVTTLRQLADKTQDEFFARRGFGNAAKLNKQSQRLSGVVLPRAFENFVWRHANARHPLPREIVVTLERLPQLVILPSNKSTTDTSQALPRRSK